MESIPDSTNLHETFAPGWPGIPARWTSSAKSGVGTAIGTESPLWFTISHGVLNEVYYPRIDKACIRDMGFIVTDGAQFFSEEKRDSVSSISSHLEGIPAFTVTNTCKQGFYEIEKTIIADPYAPVVLQRVRFRALKPSSGSYRLHIILSPHLGNHGDGNTGWVGDYKGVPMLFAQRDQWALAVACSLRWRKRSVGFVGTSDGWNDLRQHKEMKWEYTRAENGNLALTAEIELPSNDVTFEIALGFGADENEAGLCARIALETGFAPLYTEYVAHWKDWQKSLLPLNKANDAKNLYRVSTAVLKTHQAKNFPGGTIASLSIPWGFSKGDGDLGGYHLVWPRDMAQTAGALIACGSTADARRALAFLRATQEADGHWAQNMWLDGTPYWNGIQMDETALPLLVVDLAYREHVIDDSEAAAFWPMVKRAASYLARNGPVSPQDRWEEDPGYSPFTVAAEIAALLAAADFAMRNNENPLAEYFRELADIWYASIDEWMYETDTDWCTEYKVDGYYERIAEVTIIDGVRHVGKNVLLRNRANTDAEYLANHMVSPDMLALVRFGLRDAKDSRIQNTLKIIDARLKLDTPVGPLWYRYDDDGYGEHEDGAPFDGTGIGRAWPLLTGERAHYELAAGNLQRAKALLATLDSLANDGGLIPEQTWDAADIPERELYFGKPSGSAMPLVWAHAEYIKILRSLHDGKIFDMPPQTVQRYLVDKTVSIHALWRFNNKIRSMPAGRMLRIETVERAQIRWTADGWKTSVDVTTSDAGIGIYFVDLPSRQIAAGGQIIFTFFWLEANSWEGVDSSVQVE